MKDDVIFLVLIFIVSLCTAMLGFVVGKNNVQQKAVDNHVATWTVDNRGNVGFEWIKK